MLKDQKFVLIHSISILGVIGSSVILISFALSRRWYNEFVNVKQMLFGLSLAILISCSTNLIYPSYQQSIKCEIQYFFNIFSELLSYSYNAGFVYETTITFKNLVEQNFYYDDEEISHLRLKCFHILVFFCSLSVSIWALYSKDIYYLADEQQCWFDNRNLSPVKVLYLFFTLTSTLVILLCIKVLIKLFSGQHEIRDSLVITLTEQSQYLLSRMLIMPIFLLFLTFFLSIAILRQHSSVANLIITISLPANGIMNLFIYVFSDKTIMNQWGKLLCFNNGFNYSSVTLEEKEAGSYFTPPKSGSSSYFSSNSISRENSIAEGLIYDRRSDRLSFINPLIHRS